MTNDRNKSNRPGLARIENERRTFRATFERLGSKKNSYTGRPETTILVRNVIDVLTSKIVTDHLWMNETKGIRDLGKLSEGDSIEFDARVKDYLKGYMGRRDDVYDKPIERSHKLSHPTKFKKVTT